MPQFLERHVLHLDKWRAGPMAMFVVLIMNQMRPLVPLGSQRRVSAKLVLDQGAAVRDIVPAILMAMRVLRTACVVNLFRGYGN
jgi:hypothetical protein